MIYEQTMDSKPGDWTKCLEFGIVEKMKRIGNDPVSEGEFSL